MRLFGSGKTICRLLWPWPPLLDHRQQEECFPQLVPPQKADVAPVDTICLSGQARGSKLVTEEPKPVGSGEIIYSYSSIEPFVAWHRSLLLRRLSCGCVLKLSLQ